MSEDNAVIAAAKKDAKARGIEWEVYQAQLLDYIPSLGEVLSEEVEAAAELPRVDVERIFEGLEKFRQHAREQPTLEQEVEEFEREFDASQHARLTYDKLEQFIDKFLAGYELTKEKPGYDHDTLEKAVTQVVIKQKLFDKWWAAAAETEDLKERPSDARALFLAQRKKRNE